MDQRAKVNGSGTVSPGALDGRSSRMGRARAFVRDAWRLTAPYWRSEERWRARGLLALIVALTLGLVFILVLINDWNRQFYEALQDRNLPAFGPLLLRFCILATLFIIGAVYKLYFTQ